MRGRELEGEGLPFIAAGTGAEPKPKRSLRSPRLHIESLISRGAACGLLPCAIEFDAAGRIE